MSLSLNFDLKYHVYLSNNVFIKMKRVESLDYLKGLMALSVMLYHYLSMSIYYPSMGSEFLLGKLGIYAVSIFYILSGLSLSLAYDGKISNGTDIIKFYINRIFRIVPLFWFATSLAITYRLIGQYLRGETFDFPIYNALINYSLTFGFIDHDKYLTTGAWSIGNELVFYFFLPFIYILANKNRWFIPSIFLVSILLAIYFAFILLDSKQILSGNQWSTYINPLNQIFLFIGGVIIGKYGNIFKVNTFYYYIAILVCSFTFYLLPEQGDKIGIVTNENRFVLSFSCFGIVLSIYIINPLLKGIIAKTLNFLGESCYSIYLLHPLVAFPLVYLGGHLGVDKIYSYVICIPVTLVCSWLSLKYLEKPLMRFGKVYTASFSTKKSRRYSEVA